MPKNESDAGYHHIEEQELSKEDKIYKARQLMSLIKDTLYRNTGY